MATKTQAAREMLRSLLTPGPRTYTDVKEQVLAAGFTVDTLRDAARSLHVEKLKDASGRTTMWGMPGALPATPLANGARVGPPVAEVTQSDHPNYQGPVRPKPSPIQETAKRIASLRATTRSVEVWRYEEGKLSYLVTVPAAEFSMAWLQSTCGGGRYAIEGIDDDVLVSGPPLWPHRPQSLTTHADSAGQSGGRETESSTDRLLTFLLEERRAQATRASTDPMAMALEIVKVIQAAAPKPDAPAPRSSVGEIAAFLGEMKKLGIEVGAVADDEDDDRDPSFAATLKEFAPGFNRIAEIVAANKKPIAPGSALAAVAAAGQPGDSAPVVPTFPDTPAGRICRALAPSIGLVNAQARMRTPPESVAQYLFEQMDDDVVDDVDAAVDGGHFVEQVLTVGTPLIPPETIDWYRALLTHVQRIALDTREGSGHANGTAGRPAPPGR